MVSQETMDSWKKILELPGAIEKVMQVVELQNEATKNSFNSLSSEIEKISLFMAKLASGDITDPTPIDNMAPNVTIIMPTAGQSFMVGDEVSIEAVAEDVDGSITEVLFYVGDQMIKVERNTPYEAKYTITKPGQIFITAVAVDDDGAMKTAEKVMIIGTEMPVDPVDPVPVPPLPVVELYEEIEPGIIMIHGESLTIPNESDWVKEATVPGFGGNGYIVWKGENHFNKIPDVDTHLTARVKITDVEESYQLQVRSLAIDAADPSSNNDTWIIFDAGEPNDEGNLPMPAMYAGDVNNVFYPKDNLLGLSPVNEGNDGIDGFFKFYTNMMTWGMQTTAIDNTPKAIKIEFPEPGIYTIRLAPRSRNHAIDSIFLRKETLDPALIDKYTAPTIDPTPGPIDPQPPTNPGELPSFDAFDEFVAKTDGEYFDVIADELELGPKGENDVKLWYNAKDAFFGQPERFNVEDVPEMGNIRAINVWINKNKAGFYERLTVNKNNDYPLARAVAVTLDFFYLPHEKTGDSAKDRRAWLAMDGPHCKGSSIQSKDGPPPSCNTVGNPVQKSANCEVVNFSIYHAKMARNNNGQGSKGDETGKHLAEGYTKWDYEGVKGPKVDLDSEAWRLKNAMINKGLYSADITETKCQSQAYDVHPNEDGTMSNIRYFYKPNVHYRSRTLFIPNTFTAVRWDANGVATEYVDNKDGELIHFLQADSENGGKPWIASWLKGRSFTKDAPIQIAGMGWGYYLNGSDRTSYDTGMWITRHACHYVAF